MAAPTAPAPAPAPKKPARIRGGYIIERVFEPDMARMIQAIDLLLAYKPRPAR